MAHRLGLAALVAAAAGCGDEPFDPAQDPVAIIEVSPVADTLAAIGEAVQLVAIARATDGSQVPGASITWSSSDPGVSTVAQTGLATAVGNGTATIRATSGSVLGTAALTVRQQIVALEIEPAAATRVPGEPTEFTAEPLDANGFLVGDAGPPVWSLSDSAVATIDGDGVLTGIANGTTSVTAVIDTFTASANVKIVPAFQSLSLRDSYSCGVGMDSEAYCWGQGGPQLGSGPGDTEKLMPIPVLGGLSWRQVSTGGPNACGVTIDDRLFCWGSNGNGELGTDVTPETCGGMCPCATSPLQIADSLSFSNVGVGLGHSCAVGTTGDAYCWGTTLTAIGDGNEWTTPPTAPVLVIGGLAFRGVSTGSEYACAVTAHDDAYCWGDNSFFQLGDGTTEWARLQPTPVAGGIKFRTVSTGYTHTCGISTDGTAYCWGRNAEGQLGAPSAPEHSSTPVRVSDQHLFAAIGAGMWHTCAVTIGGDAYCWGQNDMGQLGNGTTLPSPVPQLVAGGHSFKSIFTGLWETCGVTIHGAAVCWGGNREGQVGDGTKDRRLSPVRVFGLPE